MLKTRIRGLATAAVALVTLASLAACAGGERYTGGATDGKISAVVTDTGGRTSQDSATFTVEVTQEDGTVRQYYCDSNSYPVCPMLSDGDTVRFGLNDRFMIDIVRVSAAPKEAAR